MCWSSEHGAIGAAPEQFLTETVPFLTVSDEKSVRSYIKNLLKKAERISTSEKQRKFGLRSRMMEKIASRAEREAARSLIRRHFPRGRCSNLIILKCVCLS